MWQDDEFELDYGPMDDELPEPSNRVRGSTQRKRKSSTCPVCPARFTNVRRHVIVSHLPWYVSPYTACWTCKVQFAQERFLQIHIIEYHNKVEEPHKFSIERNCDRWIHLMNGLLLEISQHLEKPVIDLVKLVRDDTKFNTCIGSFHHWTDIQLLQKFILLNQYSTDLEVSHKIFPPSGIHSLLHWKILALLISKTESAENILSYEKEHDLCPVRSVKKMVRFVDSHFHLDIYLRETRYSGLPSLLWEEDENVELQFLVTNYCFPHNWPSSTQRQEIRKDSRLYMTFGIHPRLIELETKKQINKWLIDLEVLIGAKRVVAIGECGLDKQQYTARKDVDRQIKVLENQLQLAERKKLPVVIHCRGDEEINDKCLSVMSKTLSKDHSIHRHCFEADLSVYHKWKASFPNCKFGISPMLLQDAKYPKLRSTVCDMNIHDLVIETDAPYISLKGKKKGTPLLVVDIVLKLSNLMNLPLEEVADITTTNARQLYQI